MNPLAETSNERIHQLDYSDAESQQSIPKIATVRHFGHLALGKQTVNPFQHL
jgi:hypothetical protein